MSSNDFSKTAQALVADGTGILAADETVPTVMGLLRHAQSLAWRQREHQRRPAGLLSPREMR